MKFLTVQAMGARIRHQDKEGVTQAMTDISFECTKCGQHLTSEKEDAGAEVVCPTCGQKLVIPVPAATGNTEPAIRTGNPRTALIAVLACVSGAAVTGLAAWLLVANAQPAAITQPQADAPAQTD